MQISFRNPHCVNGSVAADSKSRLVLAFVEGDKKIRQKQ